MQVRKRFQIWQLFPKGVALGLWVGLIIWVVCCSFNAKVSAFHADSRGLGTHRFELGGATRTVVWGAPRTIVTFPRDRPEIGNAAGIVARHALVMDKGGSLHLFWSPWSTGTDDKQSPSEIAHWSFDGSEWKALPPVAVSGVAPRDLKVIVEPGGKLNLFWAGGWIKPTVETPSRSLGLSLYRRVWSSGIWSPVEEVSDGSADPGIIFPGGIDVVASEDGTLDLFWLDLRETHDLLDAMTMGHAGRVTKTMHRRLRDALWADTDKVQKRGEFDVGSISALRDDEGMIHLFWSQESRFGGGDSGLYHATLERSGWSEPEQIAHRPLDGLHKPRMISNVKAARGSSGTIHLVWSWSGYRTRSERETIVEMRTLKTGHWSESAILSREAIDFQWAGDKGEVRGLFLQEGSLDQRRRSQPSPSPIYLLPLREGRVGEREPITESAIAGGFDGVAAHDDVYHLIYFMMDGGRMRLVHLMSSDTGRAAEPR